MVGSLKWFRYTTDKGDPFGVVADESNGELVGNTDFNEATDSIYALPSNIEPRYLVYGSIDRLVTRKVLASTLAIYNAPPSPITFTYTNGSGSTVTDAFSLVRKVPEKTRSVVPFDTGLNDGDFS